MNKQKIFKKLKQKYIGVEEMGYQVLYVSIFNWQDLEKDTYQDIICNVVVAPSLNDIINNNVMGIRTFLTDDNFFISIQDIRKITEITNKTEYVIFNKQYKELLKPLYDNGTNAELFAKIKQDLIKIILGCIKQNELGFLMDDVNNNYDLIKNNGSIDILVSELLKTYLNTNNRKRA